MVVGLLREGEDVALGGVGKVQFGMVQNGKRVFVLKGQGKGREGKGRGSNPHSCCLFCLKVQLVRPHACAGTIIGPHLRLSLKL